ncbi:MAG TPA: fructosamine kinase family protein [Mycobacteriales bacterium]|jgi:fructosamine-3-kinase|nr:fructosamine kinase family protein [Mycobacteriales bacterium]
MKVAGLELRDVRRVAGGDISEAYRATSDRYGVVFVKHHPGAPAGMFAAEASGLARLTVDGGPAVPRVVAFDDEGIVLDWVDGGPPSREAARRFGTGLAAMHRASAPAFGAAAPGYLATIALDNTPAPDWPTFHAERRLVPLLDAARGRGAIDADDAGAVQRVLDRLDEVSGPPEPPALIHGDLWSGNLLWAADGTVWLVDAASAHHGHRETDLAMLALFGAPYLHDILASYDAAYPLAAGWRDRVALHQLVPLLAHAVLFGGGYGGRAAAAARAVDG